MHPWIQKSRAGKPAIIGGFTLIEMMVSLATIGVLAAIAMPMYTKYLMKARLAEAPLNLASMSATIDAFAEVHDYVDSNLAKYAANKLTHPQPAFVYGFAPHAAVQLPTCGNSMQDLERCMTTYWDNPREGLRGVTPAHLEKSIACPKVKVGAAFKCARQRKEFTAHGDEPLNSSFFQAVPFASSTIPQKYTLGAVSNLDADGYPMHVSLTGGDGAGTKVMTIICDDFANARGEFASAAQCTQVMQNTI